MLLLLAILAAILVPQVKPSLPPRARYKTKIMKTSVTPYFELNTIEREGWQVKAAFVQYRQSVALSGFPKMPPTQSYVLVLQRSSQ